MSRSLHELTALVAEVSDTYASRNAIARDDDWYLLKLQEELGELSAEYLRTTGRGRLKGADAPAIRQALETRLPTCWPRCCCSPGTITSILMPRWSANGFNILDAPPQFERFRAPAAC